jgi:hypothetical protein
MKWVILILMGLSYFLTGCSHHEWIRKDVDGGKIYYPTNGLGFLVQMRRDATLKEMDKYCGDEYYKIQSEYSSSDVGGYSIGQMGNMYYAAPMYNNYNIIEFTCEDYESLLGSYLNDKRKLD